MITTQTKPAGRWIMGVIVVLGLGLALCAGAIFARPSAATANAPAPANPQQRTAPSGSKAGQQAAPLVSGTASATATCVVGGAPGPFRLVQHMPVPAADPGFSSDGRYAYSAGGYDIAGGLSIDQLARYDPSSDTWMTLAALPISVSLNSLVYAPTNHKLYSFGGGDDGCNALSVTQIYDIATGTWSAGTDLPAPRLGFAGAGYANGKIYLSGGELSCDNTTARAQTWIYDIAANTWMTGTNMPQALTSSASGIVNGQLYVLGGSTSDNIVLNTIYDYNVTANTWTTATTTLLDPDWLAGAAVANGRIWVIGGDDFIVAGPIQAPGARRHTGQGYSKSQLVPNAILGVSQIFDPATGTVSWGPFPNLARQDPGAAAVGNAIVVVGGYNGGNPNGDFSLDITEVSTLPNACAGTGTPSPTPTTPAGTPTCVAGNTHNPWAIVSPAPTVSFLPGVASDGTYAYVVGGSDGTIHDQVARYNPASNSWTTLAPLPVGANGIGLVYSPLNNKLYAFGGTETFTATAAVDLTRIYDIATGTWSSGAPMPAPRSRFAGAGYFNGKIYLVGGANPAAPITAQNDTWEYDVLHDSWTIKLPLPIPVADAASAVVDGHLYVIGGRTRLPPTLNTVYDYDIARDFWTLLDARLPTNIWYPGGTAVQGRVWVIGGQRSEASYITQIFDPRTRTFSEGPSLNVARYGLGAATVGNTVVAIGGYASGAEGLDTTEVTTQLPDCPPTATPTPCAITFSDVDASNPFYPYIRCLVCRGIVGGYSSSPPCAVAPCFQPGASVTRGQTAKFISNAAGYSDAIPSTRQTFTDVPPGNPFWLYVERAYAHGVISGYTSSPPCTTGVPCFLPGNAVTRGQTAKFVATAAGYSDAIPSTQQTFTDVPTSNPFWLYIERAALHGVISGYTSSPPCTTGVPCYLLGNAVTRGQTAKLIASAFYPGCSP